MNAIELLKKDHREAEGFFEDFKKTNNDEKREKAVQSIICELKIHTQVEEEIFYPEVRDALPEGEDIVQEAIEEHAEAKELIRQLELKVGAEDCSEEMQELEEAIAHHVEEEEGDMFPQVEDSALDLEDLGKRMTARKEELSKVEKPEKYAHSRRRAA